MAGIGFELRKLFQEENTFVGAKGSLAASLSTVGPMLMCMTLSFFMQKLLKQVGISYQQLQLYNVVNVYSFFLAFVLSNGLCLLGSRQLSDNIYRKKIGESFSEMLGMSCWYAITLIVVLSAILWNSPLTLLTQLLLYLMSLSLGIVLIQMVYLAAIKNYRYITLSFLMVTGIIFVVSWLSLTYLNTDPLLTALLFSALGYSTLMIVFMVKLYRVFGEVNTFRLRKLVQMLTTYWPLFLIGLFLALGLYSHHLMMWLSSEGSIIADTFRSCNSYDVPGFYAVLTIVPSIILFTVKAETSIYPQYKIFYDYIREGGNIKDIRNAKFELIETMKQEFYFMIQVQGIISFLALILGMKFLPSMGLTVQSTSIFTILCLAYFCYITATHTMILLLYFDAQMYSLTLATFFILSTLILTGITMAMGSTFYGYGFFISSLLTSILGFVLLNRYLKNIEIHTFASQPVYAKVTKNEKI